MQYPPISSAQLKIALANESERFEKVLRWLEQHMPPSFLEEVDPATRMLIARHFLIFSPEDDLSRIQLPQMAIVLCCAGPDADLRILKNFALYGIRYYRTFISNEPVPSKSKKAKKLCIAFIHFTEAAKREEDQISSERKQELLTLVKARNPEISDSDFETLIHGMTPVFLRSMTTERLTTALDMFFRAKTRDQCQYEVKQIDDWASKESPSVQLVLAWRNVPKHNFLYRLARTIHHHGLALQKVIAAYINPYSVDSVLILSLGLHGLKGGAAWEETDIDDFFRELTLLKYFETSDAIESIFVQTHLLTGNEAHLVRNFISFAHQILVYADPNLYSYENIQEGLCRHPELTVKLCQAFAAKFHPFSHSLDLYISIRNQFLESIEDLDTGQATNDLRRKNIFRQVLNFIDHTLKTNFYRNNKSAFSFRLDPQYLDFTSYDRKEKFPELPYGIFFIRGMYFIGFNIRFKDLARGGVRTVVPQKFEQYQLERNGIFSEAYNLAYTQQKKNKDIPEGGSKTAILLEPFEVFATEAEIYRREMENAGLEDSIIEAKLKIYNREHQRAFLHASQRYFIASFLTLINCEEDGTLRAKRVVDYWKRPEYIYLGPDENMHNIMIEWIADFAVKSNYRPGRSFMTSKPGAGINHKEYGVTSFGLNVYMHQTLLHLGIDPTKDRFSVKISGGPDGDVAGNQILNLYKYYPSTAHLIALVDASGTIYDPRGLDLAELARLFQLGQPISHYETEKLTEGAFLLDLNKKREQSAYVQQTLCWRRKEGQLIQDWLSGNEMNHLYRNTIHQIKADIFITAGGRPRTLNESNYQVFLDESGSPTAKAIIEGANLYLTPEARRALEKLGVLVLKDSSCNKGGVICSSFEVLASLCLSNEEFFQEKQEYVHEVLHLIGKAALNEARLLLSSYEHKGEYLTNISEKISEKINLFKYQLLDYLETIQLPSSTSHPLIRCLLLYCPPLLRHKYKNRILEMPEIHKKAVVASYIGSHLVYSRGLQWWPSIVDVLPTLSEDPRLFEEKDPILKNTSP